MIGWKFIPSRADDEGSPVEERIQLVRLYQVIIVARPR